MDQHSIQLLHTEYLEDKSYQPTPAARLDIVPASGLQPCNLHGARTFLVSVVFTTLAAAGCSIDPLDSIRGVFEDGAQADLRLALAQGAALTCAPGPSVVVTVENRGGAEAPESITTVVFVPEGSVDVRTPALGPNESVQLDAVTVPADCFAPNCRFAVLVDASFLVDESDETNNRRDGDCPASAAPPQ